MAKLLDIAQVCGMLGVSRSDIYEWLKSGELPQPIKSWGPPRWDEDQIKPPLRTDASEGASQTPPDRRSVRS